MKLILRNIMEDVVIKHVDEFAPMLGICTCEQCMLDIVAYSLNRLPAKYISTTEGELLAKIDFLDGQFNAKVTSVIVNAADIIKKSPRHKLTAAGEPISTGTAEGASESEKGSSQ